MKGMISVDEARRLIATSLPARAPETIELDAAAGRTLAEDVLARITQPPFAASAMDGYAVRIEDARQPGARLSAIGEAAAGKRFAGAVGAGEAVRIFTGAPMPAGADHVLIQEEARCEGAAVIVLEWQARAANVRPAGIDFRAGDVLAKKGETLSGPLLALIAAGNIDSVCVARRPHVAIIANGDELAPPGSRLSADAIVSSIPYALAPMIAAWGGTSRYIGIARDDAADIRRLIESAIDSDLIVPVGGASVGDRDLMRAAFAARGAAPIFEKVSVKPGKPTWFAAIAGGPFVLGLPGNPASALVTARLFLKAALSAMLGRSETDGYFAARLARNLPVNGPRESFLRARLSVSPDGALTADPFDNQDSSLLSVLARSDILIRRASGAPPARASAIAECLRF
jgi:molybdopterin molybdotransferase